MTKGQQGAIDYIIHLFIINQTNGSLSFWPCIVLKSGETYWNFLVKTPPELWSDQYTTF